MQVPLEIACPDFEVTDAIQTLIERRVEDLENICDYITSCRVTIEMPHKHQESGNAFQIRIEAHLPPGHHLVAKQHSSHGDIHDTLPYMMHETFDAIDAIEKQVQKIMDLQHGDVKPA